MRAILRQHKQTGVNDMATMTDLVLKEQEAKLPDIKRNKSGTINGNSFTWKDFIVQFRWYSVSKKLLYW